MCLQNKKRKMAMPTAVPLNKSRLCCCPTATYWCSCAVHPLEKSPILHTPSSQSHTHPYLRLKKKNTVSVKSPILHTPSSQSHTHPYLRLKNTVSFKSPILHTPSSPSHTHPYLRLKNTVSFLVPWTFFKWQCTDEIGKFKTHGAKTNLSNYECHARNLKLVFFLKK